MVHTCLPDWRARIDAAEKRGRFNDDDEFLAAKWDTCAVGEANLPEKGAGEPHDEQLAYMGGDFAAHIRVNGRAFKSALTCITRIEARLKKLYPE